MAEHSHIKNYKSIDKDGFMELCENFEFADAELCRHCSRSTFDQPLCDVCHKFLFPDVRQKRLRDDPDKENNSTSWDNYGKRNFKSTKDSSEPNSKLQRLSSQSHSLELRTILNEFMKNWRNKKTKKVEDSLLNFDVAHHWYSGLDRLGTHISELPPEMLDKIFSFISNDKKALFKLRGVSHQWKDIIESGKWKLNAIWKTIIQKIWPIYKSKTKNTNWLKVYKSLQASCFCRTCVFDMRKNPLYDNKPRKFQKKIIREEETVNENKKLGMRAVKLNKNRAHLQASITGPTDTPYEGGIFYLHIYMPKKYPFDPPIIKFLTKIIHPNISRHGDVGLEINVPVVGPGIARILLSIQVLLSKPKTKVCMEPELGNLYENNRPQFEALARHWTEKYAMINETDFPE